MSNVIKAYYVRYDDVAKKTIDTQLKFDKEIETKQISTFGKTDANGDFVEGLNAVAVKEIPTKEEINEKTSEIIESAKKNADHILEQARKEAEKIKNDALHTAQKKGYEEGSLQAKREEQKLKAEYDEKNRRLQKEFDNRILSLEPKMAEIMAALIEKITGILVEDKEDVILYLINKAVNNLDKSSEYTIRVSKEDYDYISKRKEYILESIGREVPLYITEDAALKKNQCLIETDTRNINCSLDVQLDNLITDLKLIGGI